MNFLILTHFLYFSIVEADKVAKNKVGPMIWDTLYLYLRICVQLGARGGVLVGLSAVPGLAPQLLPHQTPPQPRSDIYIDI